jgi:hypothetical protein
MIVVLLLPVLTGFVGMGTEMGLWLYDQQSEQTAADAAAFSAAVLYKQASPVQTSDTTTPASAQSQAFAVAANYGFALGGAPSCSTANNVRTCVAPANCNINAPGAQASCIEVNNPPLAGSQTANAAAFEVIVAQSPQQLFSKVLMSTPVVIKARAVGVVNNSSSTTQTTTTTTTPCTGTSCVCLKVTNASATAQAANIAGSTSLTLNHCSIEVDDTGAAGLTLAGAAALTAADIYLANSSLQYNESGTTCSASTQTTSACKAVTGVISNPPGGGFADPYQAQLTQTPANPPIPIIAAAQTTSCTGQGAAFGSAGHTINPGFYSSIIITGNTILAPGTFFICPSGRFQVSNAAGTAIYVTTPPFQATGGLAAGCTTPYVACSNGTVPFVAGDGVTIVLLGTSTTVGTTTTVTNCAYFSLAGNSDLQLIPPATGPFAGIVITSSLNCTAPPIGTTGSVVGTANISGAAATDIFGAIDLPQYSISYTGDATGGGTGCLDIVANSFTIAGNASLTNNCANVNGFGAIGPQTTTTTTTNTGTTATYAAALSN